jgi:hypothetical protein
MAEKASLNQVFQIGVETTSGTTVPANRRLTGAALSLGPEVDIKKYRPSGFKFPTVSSLAKEWTSGRIEGPVTYTELVYFLNSVVKSVNATGAGTDKTWTFSPATYGNDTVRTFTVEHGDSVTAVRFNHCMVTGLGMRFDRSGAELTGDFIGKAITSGITLTASPSDIAMMPVMVPDIAVKIASTQAGLTAAPILDRVIAAEWNLTSRFAPVWTLNRSLSYAASVETEPNLEVQFTIQANADGMAYLADMRTGDTKFLRIEAIGPVIGAGPATYKLQIDTAVKVTDVGEFEDREGVYALQYSMDGFHSTAWGRATEITVVNEIATL